MQSKWRLIEENLHVFLFRKELPIEFERLSRMLGILLLDLFFTKQVASPELAETLSFVVLNQAILILPASELSKSGDPGWFEAWCRQMADHVHQNWNQNGKSTSGGEDLMHAPGSAVETPRGEAAVRVAFGFLTEREQDLISWVIFGKIAFREIAGWLEIDEVQAREEFAKARSRLGGLLHADREIPPHLRRVFTGPD